MVCCFVVQYSVLFLRATLFCLLLQLFAGIATAANNQTASILDGDTIVYKGAPAVCPGSTLLLTLANVPANSTIKWFNTTSANVIGSSVNYEAKAGGKYFATVDANGVSYTYPTLTVTAGTNPVAGFTFSKQDACMSAPVQFNDISQGKGLTYLWDFGDVNARKLNVSNAKNPSHQFVGVPGNASQTFVVTLTVTNAAGCSNTYSQNVTLLQSPDADLLGPTKQTFNGFPYFVSCTNMPTEFTFTNNSKTNNTGYNIFWGDGTQTFVKDLSSIKHVYRKGFFVMFYTVYGANGCSKIQKYRIFVGTSPTVSFKSKAKLATCTGAPVTMGINSATNSQGTLYTASYSDSTVNAYATNLDTIMHTFKANSSSRTAVVNNKTYNNSYSVIVTAYNPCGSASDTLAPIYVSDPPRAQLINVNSDIACVNSSIHLKNNFDPGYSVVDGVSSPNKFIWKITPNDGYQASASSLGSSVGTNISDWISGTKNLNVIFTKAGEYKVTLLTGNEQCGLDSSSRELCINPAPEAAFELSTSSGCYPQMVTIKNKSNLPLCGNVQYQWSIAYDNLGCPGTQDVTFVNGTTATSAEPQLLFSGPGLYTVSLTNSFPTSGCSSATVSSQILIKAKPAVTLDLPDHIYLDNGLSPKAIVKDCFQTGTPQYKWTFAGAVDTTSSILAPDSVHYLTPGKYTIVFNVTSDCGITEVSKTIEVIKRPNLFIPNTFTPNNDGINDTWNIIGIDEQTVNVQVYNRYGALIYSRSGWYQPWDGTDSNRKLPVGVYYYILKTANNKPYSGSLTIVY